MDNLITDRLIIRELVMTDLESHHLLMSDPEIMTFIQDIQTFSLEESKNNLEFCIDEATKNERIHYFFAIEEKGTSAHVGSIGFTVIEKNEIGGNCELGYFIHKKFWNKGYTTEACKVIIDYAFNCVDLHKITTGCMAENVASEHIMIKLNMKKEAHLKKHILHNGIWKDRVEYALLKENR